MNISTLRVTATACIALALAPQSRTAELELPRDGWASWQVEAVDGAPAWCCGYHDRDAARTSCNLDTDSGSLDSHDRQTTDTLRVYAHVTGGKVERVRALASSCAVETKTPIREIHPTTDDSARWVNTLFLQSASNSSGQLRGQAMAVMAIHRGNFAHDTLAAIARGDLSVDTRKKAVFWLATLRGPAGAEVVTDRMFNDSHPELRKHAVFAITLSKSPRMAADLIRLGNTDKDRDVRAQVWFWLAHTGAESADAAIVEASRKDADAHVREQAVFALSRLPDERATRALIAAAEDPSISREQRKRAMFWLAQSESKGAQSYLDKVLAGSAVR